MVNVGTSTSPMDPRGCYKPSFATSILVGGYIGPRHFFFFNPKKRHGTGRGPLVAEKSAPSPYKTFTIFGGPKSAQETISSRSSCERHGHKATPPVPQIFNSETKTCS